jgi:hypothetical protein
MEVNDQLQALAALPPEESGTCMYWIGGWMGPRANLDAVTRRIICASARNQILITQTVATHFAD